MTAPPFAAATTFSSMVLMLRGRAALTQREVAATIGVSDRTVQVWEAGLGFPSAGNLQHLIALFASRGAFTPGTEAEEAAALWDGARAEAPRLRTAFDGEWFGSVLAEFGDTRRRLPARTRANCRDDWGEAPSLAVFHGRRSERAVLASWLLEEHCRVVGMLGMGGIGKTALAARVAQELAPQFETVFWRSLRNGQPSAEWLSEAILFLSRHTIIPEEGEAEQRHQLLDLLRDRRCLLILDNLDTVLEPGVASIAYRDGYTGYQMLLQALSEAAHQSCVIVTSRELPAELSRLATPTSCVRVLRLSGLDSAAGQALLAERELLGDESAWQSLIGRYCGNPLALQVVGECIATLFGGDIAKFLCAAGPVFGDIRRLLKSQLARISPIEREVLNWLATEREPVDFPTLIADLGPRFLPSDILEALDALDRRSLLERGELTGTFTLQPVVLEHVTEAIVTEMAAEIEGGRTDLLTKHPVLKATAHEYVRRAQERQIVQPLLKRLAATTPDLDIDRTLLQFLETWRGGRASEQRFGPGTVINLLRFSRGDLRGVDLSHLFVRHADLSSVEAQDVNLAGAELDNVLLAQQLGAAVSSDISADGEYLAVGTMLGEVRVWRLSDASLVLLDNARAGPVFGVGISADARTLANSGGSGTVWVRHDTYWNSPKMLTQGRGELWCLALSKDGRMIVVGSGDGLARIWNARTGEAIGSLRCSAGVRGVALSHDARIVVTGCVDGCVEVSETGEGARLLHARTYPGEARAVALSADGELVANGDSNGVVHLRAVATGNDLLTMSGHTGPVWGVALSGDGRLLASAGADRTLRFWDTRTGRCQRIVSEHRAGVIMASLTADGRLCTSVALDGTVGVWNTARGQCLVAPRGNVPAMFEVALSSDGRWALSGAGNGRAYVWDVSGGYSVGTLCGQTGAVWPVALSDDAELAVTGAMDATVCVWRVRTGERQLLLRGHTLGISGVALSPDKKLVASGSFDGKLRLWDASNGECVLEHQLGVAGIRNVRFCANGTFVFAGRIDGVAHVWDVRTGALVSEISVDASDVQAIVPSPDARWLATAVLNDEIRIWDLHTGDLVRVIRTGADGTRTIAFSSDGAILLVGGTDGAVRVCDVAAGAVRQVLRGHAAEVWGVALTPDTRLATSGALDGTVRVWNLRDGDGCSELKTMRPDRLYERMDITGLKGISDVQRDALFALGAISH